MRVSILTVWAERGADGWAERGADRWAERGADRWAVWAERGADRWAVWAERGVDRWTDSGWAEMGADGWAVWAEKGVEGWSYQEVLPYIIKMEDNKAEGLDEGECEGERLTYAATILLHQKIEMHICMRRPQ